MAICGQQQERKRGKTARLPRLWNLFLDLFVSYGYRLHRPIVILVVLGLLGSLLYWRADEHQFMVPIAADQATRDAYDSSHGKCPIDYPCFTPIVYSFEILTPLLNLQQLNYWLPDMIKGWGILLMIYTWFSIVFGWFLAASIGAGVSRVLRENL